MIISANPCYNTKHVLAFMIYFIIRSTSALTNGNSTLIAVHVVFCLFKTSILSLPIPLLLTLYFSLSFFFLLCYYHLNISYCITFICIIIAIVRNLFCLSFKRERTSLMLFYLVSSPTC